MTHYNVCRDLLSLGAPLGFQAVPGRVTRTPLVDPFLGIWADTRTEVTFLPVEIILGVGRT